VVIANFSVLLISLGKLAPDFDLIEKYGHISDDDAFISMDSHAAMIYFLSKDYEIVSHNSLFKRLFCREEPIIIRKNPR
jgi:hypothetical protein